MIAPKKRPKANALTRISRMKEKELRQLVRGLMLLFSIDHANSARSCVQAQHSLDNGKVPGNIKSDLEATLKFIKETGD